MILSHKALTWSLQLAFSSGNKWCNKNVLLLDNENRVLSREDQYRIKPNVCQFKWWPRKVMMLNSAQRKSEIEAKSCYFFFSIYFSSVSCDLSKIIHYCLQPTMRKRPPFSSRWKTYLRQVWFSFLSCDLYGSGYALQIFKLFPRFFPHILIIDIHQL